MASLYSALKRRRLAFSGTSGSGGLGMPPGSTLVRGAVIVTVMSWQCSLSPSSVIDGAGASQLMLAGRDIEVEVRRPGPPGAGCLEGHRPNRRNGERGALPRVGDSPAMIPVVVAVRV